MQSDISNSTVFLKRTTRVFRDTSAWYHICVTIDLTQSNADKIKLYINGTRETAFDSSTDLTSTSQQFVGGGGGYNFTIGRHPSSDAYFNGSMSHINFIDGTAYDPTAFGQYDANGVWKIKTSPSVTYGTNGFFILKDGNSVTDQSGNGNNFTVGGGTLTNTEDSPSNVFATLNALKFTNTNLTNGNTTFTFNGSSWTSKNSTLGMSSGKWYAEFKMSSATADYSGIGIASDLTPEGNFVGADSTRSPAIGYNSDGKKHVNGTATASYFSSLTTNDIVGVALDIDGGTVQFYKNGSTSGSVINLSDAFSSSDYPLFFVCCTVISTNIQANFGNGYFGTTAVSSAGTNASGNGIFEYDVPTGYTALSTKGLNL
jgi:hypothetical protein